MTNFLVNISHQTTQHWKYGVKVLLSIWTQFLDQNFSESDENMCEKCFKMEDHLEALINELKSTRLIIKILQEEIKTASTGPGIQDNLTNCA